MSFFASETIYLDGIDDMLGKVKRIDAIIVALLTLAEGSAGKDDVVEYMLDDGQTKIRTQFRGMSSILKAIQDYEKLRQMYLNRLNGRIFRLVDSQSVITRNGHHH